MKFLMISDVHLDHVTHGIPRFREVEDAMTEATHRAISEKVDAFLFGGDLCDYDCGTVWPRVAATAIRVAHALEVAGIPSVWLAGNHDAGFDGSGSTTLDPLKALGGEHVFVADDPTVIELGDADLICLPYRAPSHAYDVASFALESIAEARSSKKKAVLLSHLSLPRMHPGEETDEMGRGREMKLPQEVIAAADLVLSGHYHHPFRDGNLVVCGSPARFTFGEEDSRPGYLLGRI